MTTAELTQSLKQESRNLGFQLVGACPAVTPEGFHRFLEWLDRGYAGEMHYLEARKQAYRHPDSVLPEVKSILMLGMHYRSVPRDPIGPGQGKIARYAWGSGDYHDLIHQRLKQLKAATLKLCPDAQVRGVVDTAPLLEREFAQLAGLGWIGKNTLLLNKHTGSYFFLAALLVDFELEYDSPSQSNHCGTCTACLDACPTDAFVQPYVLDAQRCISYLTIEHRSSIPESLRSQTDGWLLGCDVCQDVCPWNRKAPISGEVEFQPAAGSNPIELRGLFQLDDDSFRARFRKTPLWRPKRRGILRNAAIILGQQPHRDNLPALQRAVQDSEPLIREAAAWALGKHPGNGPREILRLRLAVEEDVTVRESIQNAMDSG